MSLWYYSELDCWLEDWRKLSARMLAVYRVGNFALLACKRSMRVDMLSLLDSWVPFQVEVLLESVTEQAKSASMRATIQHQESSTAVYGLSLIHI